MNDASLHASLLSQETTFVQIPVEEYRRLQEELALLKNTELLQQFERLVELLYQDKFGLYMGAYTADLTEASIDAAWNNEPNSWDNV
ncbi:MAG: hypothetical protein MUF71_13655 [Candidatus Kapabacteria bacterium]|jgi:hypothetical protein|nr:hypothetical protein [Candidatus Kapabacteria bacterium]